MCNKKVATILQALAAYNHITLVFTAMGFSHYHFSLARLLQHAFILFYSTWNHTLRRTTSANRLNLRRRSSGGKSMTAVNFSVDFPQLLHTYSTAMAMYTSEYETIFWALLIMLQTARQSQSVRSSLVIANYPENNVTILWLNK